MDLLPQSTSLLLVLIYFTRGVSGITVTAPTPTGMLGDHELTLECSYVLASDEELRSLTWSKRTNPSEAWTIEHGIALLYGPSSPHSGFVRAGLTELAPRAMLILPTADKSSHGNIQINMTECGDIAGYQCKVIYFKTGLGELSEAKEISVDLTAPPLEPNLITHQPSQHLESGQTVTFTCSGNVGRPAGTFKWLKYYHLNSIPQELTTTTTGAPVKNSGNCTYNRTNTLAVVLTKDDHLMVIRCTVLHQTLGTSEDPNQMTEPVTVYYPVQSVSIIPTPHAPVSNTPSGVYYDGIDTLLLSCLATGNPAPTDPAGFQWELPNGDITSGPVLDLSTLYLNHTGSYQCTAHNSYNGKSFNSSAFIHVTVEVKPTTTLPPTTPSPNPTTDTDNGGKTDATTEDRGGLDGTTIAIIVVCSVVGVILLIVIIVVVICLRNRSKEIEEPPEKPRNNADLSFHANRPDLVSNEDKPKSANTNNGYDYKNDGLMYADLAFDDRPRSRKPVQMRADNVAYSDIDLSTSSQLTLPRV